jgi:pilus assembly protein CpaE
MQESSGCMPQPGAQIALPRWKPLLLCPHAGMARSIRAALAELGFNDVHHRSEYPRPGTIAGLAGEQGFNLCFLDVASNEEEALPLISEAAATMPVVTMNPVNDADLILRCLRRGACEFVSEATAEQVNAVLVSLARLRSPADRAKPATVYGVLPGKAGCGASTLAAHLALEMKRSGAGTVLLVDADCVTGSLAFLLKLKSSFHLGDAVRDCLRLDEDLWKRLVAPCQGIDVLTAPENPALGVALDRPAAMELICYWREHYERILLDLPGVAVAGSDFIPLCDELLLVTTNELAALHATRRAIEWLEQSGCDSQKIRLLVTRYTPATGLKREDVERALKLAPYAVLNNDYEAVQKGVLEGKPVPPGSHYGRSVHDLGQRLLGGDKTKKRASFFGLLPRRG